MLFTKKTKYFLGAIAIISVASYLYFKPKKSQDGLKKDTNPTKPSNNNSPEAELVDVTKQLEKLKLKDSTKPLISDAEASSIVSKIIEAVKGSKIMDLTMNFMKANRESDILLLMKKFGIKEMSEAGTSIKYTFDSYLRKKLTSDQKKSINLLFANKPITYRIK